MKYVMQDVIKEIKHNVARKWLRGSGHEAEFEDASEGYYAVFQSCPASIHLGSEEPKMKAGDRVRLTLEKM